MFDFFNEFFNSELAKNNILVIIITAVMLMVIGAFLMWLYMAQINMKCMENENVELKKDVKSSAEEIRVLKMQLSEVTADRDRLLEQNSKLAFYNNLIRAKEAAENDEVDSAIEQFISK